MRANSQELTSIELLENTSKCFCATPTASRVLARQVFWLTYLLFYFAPLHRQAKSTLLSHDFLAVRDTLSGGLAISHDGRHVRKKMQ